MKHTEPLIRESHYSYQTSGNTTLGLEVQMLDFTELLEGIILALLIAEVTELTYHMWKMRSYEQKIDMHIEKMESHINMMEKHINAMYKEFDEIRRTVKD